MTPSINDIAAALQNLRAQKPLIVNITNFVVMNNTANALLAIGASPLMAHCDKEMRDILMVADALVINMGTLDVQWIAQMQYAAALAKNLNLPVVLDPVGCGVSQLRSDTALSLCQLLAPLKQKVTIRGNASEIKALANHLQPSDAANKDSTDQTEPVKSKGADSLLSSEQSIEAALRLRDYYDFDLVISGQRDHILSKACLSVEGGSEMMPYVTGMGCTFSALIGAFSALDLSKYPALSPGLLAACMMAVAGKTADMQSSGPGSFQPAFLDGLYQLNEKRLTEHLNIKPLIWRTNETQRQQHN